MRAKCIVAIVLACSTTALGQSEPSHVLFHVTRLSTSDVSDEHSSGTEYVVEGYDVNSGTTYQGKCADKVFFDNEGKTSMHIICLVPQAGSEYNVKVWPTAFMFPCDTPDGECPGGDPNVTRFTYQSYTITDEEEKPKRK